MRSLDVPALERALRAPVSLVRSTGNLTRGALENARRSTAQIAAAVGERRHLAELLASPQPGTLELLDARECWALLRSRVVGRFVYVAREGTPDVVPVNYALEGRDLLIRSGSGPKLQAAERGDQVAFEVDDLDEVTRAGWSVVVYGRASVVQPAEHLDATMPTAWAGGPRDHLLRIRPRRLTGRRLDGSTARPGPSA